MKPSTTRGGDFTGNALRRREIAGFTLTETVYPSNLKMPSHSHDPAYFSLVLRGAYTENCGRVTRTCAPSDLIFHPLDHSHAVAFHQAEAGIFRVEINSQRLCAMQEHAPLMHTSREFRGGLTSTLAVRLYGEFRYHDQFSPLAVEGLVLEIIAEASRHTARRPNDGRPRWLEQVREILHAQCADSLTLSGLASMVGVHPVYLARSFRKHYRCSVGEYVRRLRVEAACREMAASRKPLSEIATSSGFYDQSHFTNAFKRYTGMTPAEFRLRFQQG